MGNGTLLVLEEGGDLGLVRVDRDGIAGGAREFGLELAEPLGKGPLWKIGGLISKTMARGAVVVHQLFVDGGLEDEAAGEGEVHRAGREAGVEGLRGIVGAGLGDPHAFVETISITSGEKCE